MHAADSGRELVGTIERIAIFRNPIILPGNRIVGNLSKIRRVPLNQIVERSWRRLLIAGVFLNRVVHFIEVLPERSFAGAHNGLRVVRRANGDQDQEDGHDRHQLKQGEPSLARSP